MWELYDELIEAIPPDLTVRECVVGAGRTMVCSSTVGTAMTMQEGRSGVPMAGRMAGMPVRELAQCVKSWNLVEAALGQAAINSALNTPQRVAELSGQFAAPGEADPNPFLGLRERMQGKRVAVIGHFPGIEKLSAVCDLSILERRPQSGDLPDSACEFILPDQDFVFITASTIANKTLPRLLELSRHAYVVLVGPSTPLTSIMFRHGVDLLAGTVVVEPEPFVRTMQEGGWHQMYRCGARRVSIGSLPPAG